jgi:hypothetical protein
LDQSRSQLRKIIQVQSIDGLLAESVASDWVQAEGRFVQVIHDHDSISEVSVRNDRLEEVALGESHAEFAADVETNITCLLSILLILNIFFNDCLQTFVWEFASVWSGVVDEKVALLSLAWLLLENTADFTSDLDFRTS